jgi:thiopeptide-type bacteriocin biosynthesis protein
MAALESTAHRWLSFHLFLDDDLEGFLTSALPGFLSAEAGKKSFRRFFFLRYSEGGLHLRLRFRVGRGPGDGLQGRLERCVTDHLAKGHAPATCFRLEAAPYDRTQHYFGETPASVYAELLNAATSRLALRLLGSLAGQPRIRRWLLLAASLDVLMEALVAGTKGVRFEESRAFAWQTAQDLFGPQALVALAEGCRTAPRWADPLMAVRDRVSLALDTGDDLRSLLALMRRTGRLPDGQGAFVNVHALHLLCNKLGFSLFEEHAAFAALSHLAHLPPTAPDNFLHGRAR